MDASVKWNILYGARQLKIIWKYVSSRYRDTKIIECNRKRSNAYVVVGSEDPV